MAENMKEKFIKEEFEEEIEEEAFEKEEFFSSFSSEEIFTVDVQREDVNIENKGVTFFGGGGKIMISKLEGMKSIKIHFVLTFPSNLIIEFLKFSFPHSSEICQRKGVSVKFILLLLNFP